MSVRACAIRVILCKSESGKRVLSLQALNLSKSSLSNGTYRFYIDEVLKTNKPQSFA